MTATRKTKTIEPDEIISLDEHIATVKSNKLSVVEEARAEGEELLQLTTTIREKGIQQQQDFDEVNDIVRQMKSKLKFLDEERKVSVQPLDREVERINAWYRPALTVMKQVIEQASAAMSAFVVKQQREKERLQAEAAAAAAKALAEAKATDPAVQSANAVQMQAAKQHMTAARAVTVSAAKGTTMTPKFKWVVKDVSKLPKELTMVVPNKEAIDAWVKEHGDKDVPEGLEVTRDVQFTHRK